MHFPKNIFFLQFLKCDSYLCEIQFSCSFVIAFKKIFAVKNLVNKFANYFTITMAILTFLIIICSIHLVWKKIHLTKFINCSEQYKISEWADKKLRIFVRMLFLKCWNEASFHGINISIKIFLFFLYLYFKTQVCTSLIIFTNVLKEHEQEKYFLDIYYNGARKTDFTSFTVNQMLNVISETLKSKSHMLIKVYLLSRTRKQFSFAVIH